GAVDRRRLQQQRPYFRREVDAAPTGREPAIARSARMDDVQYRREVRLSVYWRRDRNESTHDRRRVDRRASAAGPEREDGRYRFFRRPTISRGRSVWDGPGAVRDGIRDLGFGIC